MAVLALQRIIIANDKELLWNQYKKGLFLTAGSFLLLLLIYLNSDFKSQADSEVLKQANQTSQEIKNYITQVLSAVKDDRASLFLSSLYRSLVFILIAATALWLYIKRKISAWIMLSIIGILSFVDLISVDVKYLNSENYQDELEYNQSYFTPSELDNQLLTDTSFYRVLDRRQGPNRGGAMTAYFHKSIEGYNAAKLSIYQDLVEHQLLKLPQTMHILNMLNTKYILQTNQQGQDVASINSENLGPVWFVKALKFEPTSSTVMNALTNLTPKDTAVVFARDQKLVSFLPTPNPSDTIFLVKNINDEVIYQSNTSSNRFAVFSEVFYDKGWKAFIDEKEVPIVRTNYVLRGLSVPVGKHDIRFFFRPASVFIGKKVATFSGIVVWLLIIGAIVYSYKKLALTP